MNPSGLGKGTPFLLVVMGLACLFVALESGSQEIPLAMGDSLEQLKASFWGTAGSLEPSVMRREVERNRDAINTVLGHAEASEDNAARLAEYLFSSLNAYAERFKPGTEIDEQMLSARPYKWGTQPEYGLSVEAYLLLQMAKQQEPANFTRRALSTLYDVVLARAYLAEKRTLHNHPEDSDEVAREKRESGGPLTDLGGEIAWCCEEFMVDEYLADDPGIPEPGMAVITEYWQWRRETMVEWGRADCLHLVHQHRTMEYVKKLAEALSEDAQSPLEEGEAPPQ